nr:hypothetical protein [Actinomycetota bacterium]
GSSPAAPGTTVLDERPASYADGATSAEEIPYAQGAPFAYQTPFAYETPFAQGGPRSPGAASGPEPGFGPGATRLGTRAGAVVATMLLATGVILGIAGLFPDYLAGVSLTQQTPEVVPHAIYLAVWTVSAVLIMLGGGRLRLGALLGAGLSLVTFGLFLADAGTAIVGGAHEGGWGLWLSLAGWLACAAGSVLALLLKPAGGRRTPLSFGRPRGAVLGPVVVLVLAGLGVAAAFAPAWDSYTLRTAAGVTRSLTEGNAFANPGLVIAGDIAVMIALAAVVILVAVWRPVRHGAVLLAGAAAAMVAQAISAGIQVGEGATAAQFGITPGQASQLGLTIDSGVTLAFWLYCGFLLVLTALCGWMLFTPHDDGGPAPGRPAVSDAFRWPAGTPASAPGSGEDSSGP